MTPDRRKAVAHYAAQEDAARDYADARRYRWIRDFMHGDTWTMHALGLIAPESANEETEILPDALDAAIDMELERAGRAT